MSDKLAISAAVSVLLMSAFVLLDHGSQRLPLGPTGASSPIHVEVPELRAPDFGFTPLMR